MNESRNVETCIQIAIADHHLNGRGPSPITESLPALCHVYGVELLETKHVKANLEEIKNTIMSVRNKADIVIINSDSPDGVVCAYQAFALVSTMPFERHAETWERLNTFLDVRSMEDEHVRCMHSLCTMPVDEFCEILYPNEGTWNPLLVYNDRIIITSGRPNELVSMIEPHLRDLRDRKIAAAAGKTHVSQIKRAVQTDVFCKLPLPQEQFLAFLSKVNKNYDFLGFKVRPMYRIGETVSNTFGLSGPSEKALHALYPRIVADVMDRIPMPPAHKVFAYEFVKDKFVITDIIKNE